jgi:hypothetical protein
MFRSIHFEDSCLSGIETISYRAILAEMPQQSERSRAWFVVPVQAAQFDTLLRL